MQLNNSAVLLFEMAIDIASNACDRAVSPCVAGGAVRDALLGRDIKDIDLFVPMGCIQDAALEYHFPEHREFGMGLFLYAGVHQLKRIVSLGKVGGVELQLIEYDDRHCLFDTFDIGLCRVAYYAGDKRAMVSQSFFADVMNKTMTVLRCHGTVDRERTVKRLERIGQKYPEHRIVWEV